MNRLFITTIAVAFLTSGCRAADNRPQIGSLGSELSQRANEPVVAPQSTADRYRQPVANLGVAGVDRLPTIKAPIVLPVAYQHPSNVPAPDSPEAVPAPGSRIAESSLSLINMEGIALQNNPAIAQAVARVEVARGFWVQSGLPPNPTFGYSGQQLGSGGTAEQQGAFLGQLFITGQKLRLNRESAAWNIQRSQRELDAVRLRVLMDVRIGYYDVLIAQRRRELAAKLVDISNQGVQAAQALFQGEEVSEADPLRARIEMETARILLQNSANQHFESWRRLTAVMGTPEIVIQRIEGDLESDQLQLVWQETLQQVLTESPEIGVAIANVEAARWAVRRAIAQVIPDVDVQAIVQGDRSTGSSNANLQITLPLPIINRNQGGIRMARARAIAAERSVDRIALSLQSRLAIAFRRYESAQNQVYRYSRKDGILETAERTLSLIRTGYKADEFGVLELLTAQRTYFQTNLAYLDSQRELWVSIMEIRGLLLRETSTLLLRGTMQN